MADLAQIVDDLRAESDELDALVAPLAEDRWSAPTPAKGWTIAHQIGHLLWTDRGALVSVTDSDAFADNTPRSLGRCLHRWYAGLGKLELGHHA